MIGIRPGSFRSALHVVFQIALVVLIYITGITYPREIYLLSFYALFFILAFWSMYIMKFRFNISPEPFDNIRLVSGGPYRLIRHPMYTSLLGVTLCLVIGDFSYARLVYWILLFLNMFLKLKFEEKILSEKFAGYKEYMKNTKRLIPFIF